MTQTLFLLKIRRRSYTFVPISGTGHLSGLSQTGRQIIVWAQIDLLEMRVLYLSSVWSNGEERGLLVLTCGLCAVCRQVVQVNGQGILCHGQTHDQRGRSTVWCVKPFFFFHTIFNFCSLKIDSIWWGEVLKTCTHTHNPPKTTTTTNKQNKKLKGKKRKKEQN